ncbi:hypothetical protein OE648_08220 [Pseudomonas moraviensis]|uniref:hypothetical protein n=1 Tax=Pseudomonas moraviensis TaxID=321662 RepID=UPI002B2D676D|nr:hypothetical protein OE648_08220 [Pseudomonas moraviensis]
MTEGIDWAPLIDSFASANWTAILVALISGVVAIYGPTRLWRKQSKRESESVRASLIAEIAALVDIVELRRFLPALREKQALLAARQTAIGAFRRDPESYEVRIDNQFNRVYQASVTKLGMLTAEEARQIVRFHQLADSVRLDVIPGGDLATGTDSAEKFGAAADLLEMALVIGHALVDSKQSGS